MAGETNKIKWVGIRPVSPAESIPIKAGVEGAIPVTLDISKIQDTDRDTRVETEENVDEDKVKIYIQNVLRAIFIGLKNGLNQANPENILHITENSSDTGDGVGVQIEQEGSGDAQQQYHLAGVQKWQQGVDNSDSNAYKVSHGSDGDLGTDTALRIGTEKKVTVYNNFRISKTDGQYDFGDDFRIVKYFLSPDVMTLQSPQDVAVILDNDNNSDSAKFRIMKNNRDPALATELIRISEDGLLEHVEYERLTFPFAATMYIYLASSLRTETNAYSLRFRVRVDGASKDTIEASVFVPAGSGDTSNSPANPTIRVRGGGLTGFSQQIISVIANSVQDDRVSVIVAVAGQTGDKVYIRDFVGFTRTDPDAGSGTSSPSGQITKANVKRGQIVESETVYIEGGFFVAGLGTLTGKADVQYDTNTKEIGYVVSARKYKVCVRDILDSSWIHKLRPRSFIHRNDIDMVFQHGLIAEEVADVNADIVGWSIGSDGKKEYESVSYTSLIIPILSEVQKLRREIDSLKKQLGR